MSIIKKIFGQNEGSEIFTDEELANAQVCPNCWGREAYDGKYTDYVKDQTKSNINHDHLNQKAFIAQFVETYVTGIRLKAEGEQLVCPSCKTKYKHVSSKTN